MKNLKKNAAAMLLALFCAVFMLPSIILTGCTNGEDGDPIFTPSQKYVHDTIKVIIVEHDTMWRDTTIIIEVEKLIGLEKDGEPGLEKTDDESYHTWYPIKENGEPKDVADDISVGVEFAKVQDIFVTNDSLIGNAKFNKGARTTKRYVKGDFTRLRLDAEWIWTWRNGYSLIDKTHHEKSWYKGFIEMLTGYWTEECDVEYGDGKAYTHEGVEGRLFIHKIIRRAIYQSPGNIEDDVRENIIEQPFFVPNGAVPEPDPEAKRVFKKNAKIETTPENNALTSFEVWEELTDGTNKKLGDAKTTIRFWLTDAEGNVIDLGENDEFSLRDLTPVEGTKTKVGEPRQYGNILIQEYVTTYTTKYAAGSQEKESIFYGHTEEATLIIPESLGGNIDFLHGDFKFKDLGTSKLQDMADESNFERKQAFSRIIAIYIDRTLDAEGEIILRKVTDEPVPEKKLTGYQQISWDDENSYVIRHFYDDNTYEDITVTDDLNCTGHVEIDNGTKIYRDNINFGKPTITKNGAATKEGSATTNNNITRQQMVQPMTASYDGYNHGMKYHYTSRSYSKSGLKPIDLSVPMWILTHKASNDGSVRKEIENNKNYDVTPMTFVYSTAFGKTASDDKSHAFEVWKYISDVAELKEVILKNFGFDYVNQTTSYAYATFFSVMSDNTEKELGVDGVNVYNEVIVPAGQTIDTEDFNVSDATPIPGTKTFVSSREAPCKFGGKFVINKYSSLYTTRTNKASHVFTFMHEEVTYVPEKGNQVTDSKWQTSWEISDLGSSPLVDLGRKNGKDGKMYNSQISASYNGRSNGTLTAEVNLWVKSPNRYGIASASQSHTWDYENAHHVASVFVYNVYENGVLVSGGLKGFIDGKEVVKKSWDEVNAPSGVVGLAQNGPNGTWVFCKAIQSGNAFTWRSIEKANNNSPISSVDIRQLQTQGTTELLISSAYNENADGSVTVSSKEGTATASAW